MRNIWNVIDLKSLYALSQESLVVRLMLWLHYAQENEPLFAYADIGRIYKREVLGGGGIGLHIVFIKVLMRPKIMSAKLSMDLSAVFACAEFLKRAYNYF